MAKRGARLTPAGQKKVNEYFDQWPTKFKKELVCEACGSSEWYANDRLTALPEESDNVLNAPSKVVCVALICVSCGNTKLFATKSIGVEDRDHVSVDEATAG